MDEQEYEKQFEALTDGMRVEAAYDALANRADFVRQVIGHCAELYKGAREAGLPRGVCERMSLHYFQFEVTPAPSNDVYVVESGDDL